MLPSDPFMSHLATQLGYSAGEFQALQLIVLATFGVVDLPLASCMLVHLLEIDFKQQLGCRFDIMDSISSFFCILTYAIIYVLIHHIIFWLNLYFLNVLYLFSSTPVLTSSIDVIFVLSMRKHWSIHCVLNNDFSVITFLIARLNERVCITVEYKIFGVIMFRT